VSAIGDALRALADAFDSEFGGRSADELLDLVALRERYGLGRDAILGAVGRGELVASRGARGKILVSRAEVERWIASRPVTVRTRERARSADVVSIAAWERDQQAELDRARRRR
jgi:hypothetical protein